MNMRKKNIYKDATSSSLLMCREKYRFTHQHLLVSDLKSVLCNFLKVLNNKIVLSFTEPRSPECLKAMLGSPSSSLPHLLTLHPCAEMTRMSAGIRSPPFTSTRSPTTTFSTLICIFSPSRITRACCGKIVQGSKAFCFCNPAPGLQPSAPGLLSHTVTHHIIFKLLLLNVLV